MRALIIIALVSLIGMWSCGIDKAEIGPAQDVYSKIDNLHKLSVGDEFDYLKFNDRDYRNDDVYIRAYKDKILEDDAGYVWVVESHCENDEVFVITTDRQNIINDIDVRIVKDSSAMKSKKMGSYDGERFQSLEMI